MTDCKGAAPDPETFTEDEMRKDVFHVFWSSGTTGSPKGIGHTQYSVLNWSGLMARVGKKDISFASTTTFYHVGGFINAINAIEMKRSYWHVRPHFLPKHEINDIDKEGFRNRKWLRVKITHYFSRTYAVLHWGADDRNHFMMTSKLPLKGWI